MKNKNGKNKFRINLKKKINKEVRIATLSSFVNSSTSFVTSYTPVTAK